MACAPSGIVVAPIGRQIPKWRVNPIPLSGPMVKLTAETIDIGGFDIRPVATSALSARPIHHCRTFDE